VIIYGRSFVIEDTRHVLESSTMLPATACNVTNHGRHAGCVFSTPQLVHCFTLAVASVVPVGWCLSAGIGLHMTQVLITCPFEQMTTVLFWHCLSVYLYNSKTTWPNFMKFLCILPMGVARSSSGSIVIDSNQILLSYKDQQVLIMSCAPGQSLLSVIALSLFVIEHIFKYTVQSSYGCEDSVSYATILLQHFYKLQFVEVWCQNCKPICNTTQHKLINILLGLCTNCSWFCDCHGIH